MPLQFVMLSNKDINIGKKENINKPIKLGNKKGKAFFQPDLPFAIINTPIISQHIHNPADYIINL